MQWNGILVTGAIPDHKMDPETSYRGVCYGTAWPLENMYAPEANSQDEELINEVNNLHSYYYHDGRYALEVVSDIDLISRYVERCQVHNLPVRTLLCATDRVEPILNSDSIANLIDTAVRLGYDYAYSSCRYSAVYEEIFPSSTLLASFCSKLNQNGLFESLQDLSEYVSAREEIIRSTPLIVEIINDHIVEVTPLEYHGDFLPIEVWELQDGANLFPGV